MNGDEVGSDDRERVAVKLDANSIVGRGVDEPETMLLARGQLNITILTTTSSILVRPVEQDIVGRRWRRTTLQVGICFTLDLECRLVEPVLDGISSEIDVIVGRCRAFENNSADNTVGVL